VIYCWFDWGWTTYKCIFPMYTLGHKKTCHFIFTYNSVISSLIFTLLRQLKENRIVYNSLTCLLNLLTYLCDDVINYVMLYVTRFIWEIWWEILTMLSREDKILIKNLWESETYSSRRLIKEFPNKNWKRRTLDDFLQKLRSTGRAKKTSQKHIFQTDKSPESWIFHERWSGELFITTWISNA